MLKAESMRNKTNDNLFWWETSKANKRQVHIAKLFFNFINYLYNDEVTSGRMYASLVSTGFKQGKCRLIDRKKDMLLKYFRSSDAEDKYCALIVQEKEKLIK